jgi:hypothetical protein
MRGKVLGLRPVGWITMTGLRSFLRIALIIALALVLLVFLGFGAYSIFLIAKSLIGLVWYAHR